MLILALYSLAGLIAMVGLMITVQLWRSSSPNRAWLITAVALLLFAIFCGSRAYQFAKNPLSSAFDLIEGFAALAISTLACTAILSIKRLTRALIQSEENSRQERERYRSIIERLPLPIVLKDRELIYQFVNIAFAELLGKGQNQIVGKKDADFFPRPQLSALIRADVQVLQGGETLAQEQELVSAKGKKWMRLTHEPILENGDEISGILMLGQEITERKQMEQTLQDNKLLLEALTNEKRQLIEENYLALENQAQLQRLARLLVAIAIFMIDADMEKIDQGIQSALRSIGLLTNIDRCRILLYNGSEGRLKIAFSWSSHNVTPNKENPSDLYTVSSPWAGSDQTQIIHVSCPAQLSADEDDLAEFMRAQGIQSFTAVPLISNRIVMGFLWLETKSRQVNWGAEFQDLLRIAGQLFVSALGRKDAIAALANSQQNLQSQLTELEQQNLENNLLNELRDLLQVCRTMDEAYPIIVRYTQQLVPFSSGGLYLVHEGDDRVERTAAWGDAPPPETELIFNECWGLRRGRLHLVQDSQSDLNCGHVNAPMPSKYLCVPLIAQGDTIGLLHLRPSKDSTASPNCHLEDYQRVSQVIAEQIALALSNLSLHDRLRSQAIRDPLTGLFNRRYMEETLEREIRRAARHNTPVSVVMFDIDHLKRVNDTFGHDAGDIILRNLGDLMIKAFRGEDVPCRYGGDEFTIVLPEATVSETFRRAEQFREAFKKLDFSLEGRHFGPLTLSIGIASYPDHGTTVERLLQTADAASYAAKIQGRDRVMIGGLTEE